MKFKINAVKYAKETNVSEASRKFEVDRKRIREWVSHFDVGKLQEHVCLGVEGSLKDVDIDQDIFEWFWDQRIKPRHARHWQSLTCGSSAPLLCRRNYGVQGSEVSIQDSHVTNTRQLDN